jgi:heptosyltransferase-3
MTPRPRRVLVVVTRRIGDVLLATPVLRSLKRAWPKATIDVLVFSSTAGVLSANPDIGSIIVVPERPGFVQHIVFIAKLFRRYDWAISLLPGDRPTLYAFLAGHKRVGLLLATHKQRWKRWLLNHWIAYDSDATHTVLTHLSVLGPLGVAPIPDVTPSWREADAQRAAEALSSLHEKPFVVLHLYPKFNYKMWHDAGWIALAHWIAARGLSIVLTGSNDPVELDYVQRISACMQGTLNLAGQLTLNECASVITRAAAYVGPDTALTHMAAALGVPTIALFGPTNALKWGPWPHGHKQLANPWRRIGSQRAGNVTLLQGAGACVPCGLEGCRREVSSFSDCLQSLPVEKVIAAIEERLR